MKRVQPQWFQCFKIQKLISFPRSPKEHFSLKPCKVILVFFSVHGFTGCIPPCKFRLKLLCLSSQQTKSNGIETSFLIGDMIYDGSACVCTVVGNRFLLYTWFSRLLLSKLFLILVFSCPCHSPDFEEKQGPKKTKIPLSKSK